MMTQKMLAAPSLLILAVFGANPCGAQTNDPSQSASTAASPAATQKVVTKDPEYLKLLNPPKGNDFLRTYSKSYRDAYAEIEAKIAGITDENLRTQTSNDEWTRAHKNDGDKFQYEAEAAFHEAKVSFAQKHRDGWFDVGRVSYNELNKALDVASGSTSPIYANFHLPMNAETLNMIYEKFHEITAQEIDQKTQEYISKAGPGSTCSRNPDWCYSFAKQDIEQTERAERIVVVALGDLEAGRIDRLLLVDYSTEAVLLELDAPARTLASAVWRFSIGLVPAPPIEPVSAEAVAQAAAAAAAETLATPIKLPADVTAASIVTQIRPEYPSKARAAHIEGDVVLHAIIDKEGKISEVRVLSGDDVLAQSAVEAIRQWRYKPMLVDGEAKEVDTTITVTFSLRE